MIGLGAVSSKKWTWPLKKEPKIWLLWGTNSLTFALIRRTSSKLRILQHFTVYFTWLASAIQGIGLDRFVPQDLIVRYLWYLMSNSESQRFVARSWLRLPIYSTGISEHTEALLPQIRWYTKNQPSLQLGPLNLWTPRNDQPFVGKNWVLSMTWLMLISLNSLRRRWRYL